MNAIYSATDAKQNFGDVLSNAESGPVEIQKHGKTVAWVVSSAPRSNAQTEKRLARVQQDNVEAERLIRHQQIAIQLLLDPRKARTLVGRASSVVDRWEAEHLCSRHYVDRWRELLALPTKALAQQLGEDLEGWGRALRQNSPWMTQDDTRPGI